MRITRDVLKHVYKIPRKKYAKKGDYGKLLIIGGSRMYSGSPALNALAALRSGCDLVTVAAPVRSANIIASFSPDLITVPLEGEYLNAHHIDELLGLIKKSDAVLIGGGLSRHPETLATVQQLLSKIKKPIVIDADAIHAVTKKMHKNVILTPHGYEFYVFTGRTLDTTLEHRVTKAKDAAKHFGCTILLKGVIDVITDGVNVSTNDTGNAYMTKGGTGDVLAGICGSLVAQGAPSYHAACAAAFINGSAGDRVAKKYGFSLLASDLLSEIHHVIRL